MAGDSFYGSRVLGLHFNEANNSTTFTDNSPTQKTLTAVGNVKISTAQSKFGSSSALFDGNGDFLSATITSAIGNADFCISAWVRLNDINKDCEIICIGPDQNVGDSNAYNLIFECTIGGALRGVVRDGSGTNNIDITTSSGVLASSVWHHVVFSVDNTTARLFVDGDIKTIGTLSGGRANPAVNVRIGHLSTGFGGTATRYFDGYIDELMLWKGVPVHTANFTLNTTQYDDSYSNIEGIVGANTTSPIALINAAVLTNGKTDANSVSPFADFAGNVQQTGKIDALTLSATSGFIGHLPQNARIEGDLGSATANIKAYTPFKGKVDSVTLSPTANYVGYIYIIIDKTTIVSRKYLAVLTGTPDIQVPISSISSTFRESGSVSVTVVCPDGINFATEILARKQGTLIITGYEYFLDGTFVTSETARLTNLEVTYSHGPRNYSITIQGTQTLPAQALVRKVTVKGIQTETLQANGIRRIRCDLNNALLPNDIVIMPDASEFVAGSVQHIITTTTKAMEIAELA